MPTREGFSQVAINSNGLNADPSAMLDINANNKGLLIPRVSLNGPADNLSPILNPAVGLLVYNTSGNILGPGVYMWNGLSWSSVPTLDQVLIAVSIPSSVFGEMYEYHPAGTHSDISIPAGGTYTTWTTTDTVALHVAAMSYTPSALIIETTGVYSVSFSSAVQASASDKIIEAALFVNDVRKDNLHGRSWFNASGKSQNISFSGMLTAYASDVITVRYTMNDIGTISIEIANLSMTKLDQ